ncbi:hypothetical protein RN001_004095 [Aquatica leii]|uniref:Kazal-like domain-containing protein n=1 Tax=Aquatica leii TaxID=1421715 RepID=A0AAN7Q706_9COLE|nr:hypothetical protein RN001_004095 [Aquatica leii]
MYTAIKVILLLFLICLIPNANAQDTFLRSNLRGSRQRQNNRQSIESTQENFSQSDGFPEQQANNFGNTLQQQTQQRPGVIRPSTISPSGPETTAATTKAPQAYVTCLQACPATPEYNPICGTNSETFTNLSRFRCAQKCGLRVDILFNGRC